MTRDEVDDIVTLDASQSFDPDGDGLTYEWIQTGGPAVSLAGSSTSNPGTSGRSRTVTSLQRIPEREESIPFWRC